MDYKFKDETNDRKHFTIIPNYVLNHADAVDKALYLDIKRAAGENGFCFMTEETMCRRNKIGKEKLHKSIKYLLKHEWIEFVGMTPSKTRPIKTYKVLDIWKRNADFFSNKKIPPRIAVSQNTPKDTAVSGGKIPPRKGGIRRTNIKKNNQQEAKASGLTSLRKTLEDKKIIPIKGGATHAWQDAAVQWWKKLGLGEKPTASWFKQFRLCLTEMERACSWASDSGGNDLEKLTYWALNQFKKYGKIVYEKPN